MIGKANPKLAWFELSWPKDLNAEQVHAWLQAIGGNNGSRGMRFIVRAEQCSIKYYLALPRRHKQHLLQYLASFVPDIQTTSCGQVVMLSQTAAKLRMTSKHRVLNVDGVDITCHAIISALQVLGSDESIIVECILGNCKSPEIVSNKQAGIQSSSVVGAAYEAIASRPAKLEAAAHASMQDKHAVAAWQAAMIVGVNAKKKHRRNYLLEQIKGAIKSAEAPGVRLGLRPTNSSRLSVKYTPLFWPSLLNVSELIGLLAWPLGDREVVGITRIASRHLAIQDNNPAYGKVIAASAVGNDDTQLRITPKDSLMHLHVMAPTGAGKSTLLLNLITQDIYKGFGVTVVDPKGDLLSDILCRIPKNRQHDVVVLDPSDDSQPVGLNPLARHGQPANLIADDILSIFRRLYGSYFGARSQDILHSGLLTLMSQKNATICDLPTLFNDSGYRNNIVGKLDDPYLQSFWDWYENSSPSDRNAAMAPLMNKLRQFMLRKNLRLVLGQESPKFDVSEVFTKRKILLVNMARGKLGSEASQLFGSFVVSQIVQAAMARANIPAEKRTKAFVYLDEFQNVLNVASDIDDVLAQSRGFGVGMVLAHQHLAQLPRDLKAGVLANARSRIAFQLGLDDAVELAKSTDKLTAQDFQNLDRYNIYAQLVRDGTVSPWVSGVTLPPIEPISDPEAIRALSRQRYGVPASEIEAAMLKSMPVSQPPAVFSKIGRKKLDFGKQLDAQIAYRNMRGEFS